MSLRIDFDDIWNEETQSKVESALRSCIGDPDGENWTALVTSFGSFLHRSGENNAADTQEAVPSACFKTAGGYS